METKLKFKVGDKVRVKSLEWYNDNKDAEGLVYLDKEGIVFDETMTNLCGKIVQIEEVNRTGYFIYGYSGFLQDWMLEDEVVTAEEQQLKTKEMTKEEVFEFLKNTKILCTSKEESIKVQVALFAFGVKWISRMKGIDEDKYLLFINNKLEILHTSDIDYWMDDVNKRIEPNEIFAIQIKEEEKPKFDPKTLQPFDKVLVRENDKYKEWFARFFEYYVDDEYHTTSGTSWKYCIPYNDETKHLHGTIEEAPEFYRIKKK